jgi:hypothetical protein
LHYATNLASAAPGASRRSSRTAGRTSPAAVAVERIAPGGRRTGAVYRAVGRAHANVRGRGLDGCRRDGPSQRVGAALRVLLLPERARQPLRPKPSRHVLPGRRDQVRRSRRVDRPVNRAGARGTGAQVRPAWYGERAGVITALLPQPAAQGQPGDSDRRAETQEDGVRVASRRLTGPPPAALI